MLHIAEIVARLADEGVPVAAIARSTDLKADAIRTHLDTALKLGHLTELPRADWPPGQGRHERVPERPPNTRLLQDTQVIAALAQCFGITRMQGSMLLQLVKRPRCTKEALHEAICHGRSEAEMTKPKIVDVVICRLREALKDHGVQIKTLWGMGYFMEAADRKRVAEMLRDKNPRLYIFQNTEQPDEGLADMPVGGEA